MFGITDVQAEMAAEKRRRDKKDRDEEPMTDAHVQAEAEMAEGERDAGERDAGEAARKAIADIGCTDGPGVFGVPHDMAGADAYNRPYLDAGHSAPSPVHQAPNVSPVPPQGRGILEPTPMPGLPELAGHNGPIVQGMLDHQARAASTMPRMPIPRGAA